MQFKQNPILNRVILSLKLLNVVGHVKHRLFKQNAIILTLGCLWGLPGICDDALKSQERSSQEAEVSEAITVSDEPWMVSLVRPMNLSRQAAVDWM